MQILFITNLKISPGGGGVFSKSILDSLKSIGEVDELVLQNRNERAWFGRAVFGMIWGYLFHKIPLRISYYFSFSVLNFLRENKKSYDFIVLDHLESTWILGFNIFPLKKIIYVSHNDEYSLLVARVNNNRVLCFLKSKMNFLYVGLRYLILGGFEAYQDFVLETVPRVLSISDDVLSKVRGRGERILPSFSYPSFLKKEGANFNVHKLNNNKISLGFIGNLNWWPNKNGLLYFLKNIFPRVQDFSVLNIYGFGVPQFFTELALDDDLPLNKIGFVESLDDIWSQIDVMIVPVFEGAGANVKFAEILFNGVPVIVSGFVYDQYSAKLIADPAIAVCNFDDEWVESILKYASAMPGSVSINNSNLFSAFEAEDKIIKLING